MSYSRPVELVPLPAELRAVSRSILEDYVLARLRQFSKVFAQQLQVPVTEPQVEYAYARAMQVLGNNDQREVEGCRVRFTHKCRFLGCMRKECLMCKNNPNKKCRELDNFDECYADNQVLKSKCESDVTVELVNSVTGQRESIPGVEIMVTVIDGESYSETGPSGHSHVRHLLKSDEGQVLLGSYVAGNKPDGEGRLFLKLQDGWSRLPDLHITDKNDTFHMNGETYASFRLMGQAIKRDLYGNAVLLENIPPAVSQKFIVKTQRALNDYRKSEYPHFKDELTKLKFIGSITAQRLREIQQHLGPDVPFQCIETVEHLKQLMGFADMNRQVENKLLELLNMKGKHKHKWDYLREILAEKVVYDDNNQRVWYKDDTMTQGLLYPCKQGQVNLDKPTGLVLRSSQGGQTKLQIVSHPDAQQMETIKLWRPQAEADWYTSGHRGWHIVNDQVEITAAASPSLVLGNVGSMGLHTSMSMEALQDEQMGLARRASSSIHSPHAPSDTTGRRRSSLTHPSQVPQDVQAMAAAAAAQMEFQYQNALNLASSASNSVAAAAAALQSSASAAAASNIPTLDTFQFTGHRGINTMVTSGVAGSSTDALLADIFRAASAPQTLGANPGLFNAPSPEVSGETAGGPPVRSHRYRRMSADAGIARQQQQQVQLPTRPVTPDAYFNETLELSFNKRPRSSAPGSSFLDGNLTMAMSAPTGLAPFQSRVALYHQESQGRHTPRGRISPESLSQHLVQHPPAGMANAFDTNEIDIFLKQNMNLQGSLQAPGLQLGSESSRQLSAQLSLGPGASPHQHDAAGLSSDLQHNLQLTDDAMMGGSGAGAAVQGARMLMHSGTDSFNDVLSRMLTHSDSDSFRRLLDPGFASHGHGADITFDLSGLDHTHPR